jgi:ribosomal 50S subunit-associated protein YjgA (DUF615 family)
MQQKRCITSMSHTTFQYQGVPEPIQKALDTISSGQLRDARQLEELQRWRDELVEGSNGLLEEILSRFPGADRLTMLGMEAIS